MINIKHFRYFRLISLVSSLFIVLFSFKSSFAKTEPVYAESIFLANEKESQIRSIVENLLFLKVLETKETATNSGFIAVKRAQAMQRVEFLQAKDGINSKLNEVYLIKQKEGTINAEFQYLEHLYRNFRKEDLLAELPAISTDDRVFKFYSVFFDELFRLYSLFGRHPSEIKVYNNKEIQGFEFMNREVFLTFDDGPTPYTPKIAKVLNEHHIQATFFILGNKLTTGKTTESKETIKGLIRMNHIIGIHSMTHKNLASINTPNELSTELFFGKQLVQDLFSYHCRYFRAPYGSRTASIADDILTKYEKHILWNIDSQDWQTNFTKEIIKERVIRLAHLYNGGIVLFHDTQQKVADVLPAIISDLRACGFDFKAFN